MLAATSSKGTSPVILHVSVSAYVLGYVDGLRDVEEVSGNDTNGCWHLELPISALRVVRCVYSHWCLGLSDLI